MNPNILLDDITKNKLKDLIGYTIKWYDRGGTGIFTGVINYKFKHLYIVESTYQSKISTFKKKYKCRYFDYINNNNINRYSYIHPNVNLPIKLYKTTTKELHRLARIRNNENIKNLIHKVNIKTNFTLNTYRKILELLNYNFIV